MLDNWNMRFWRTILCFFILGYSIAQETPPILQFSPSQYKAANQNWAIAQGIDDFIYVANNDGLLEFNGSEWNLYPSPNNTNIRSVAIIDSTVYTGSYMEFGYWKRNALGSLEYESITQTLDFDLIEDEYFWNIIGVESWILFQSYDRIYIYDKETGDITTLTDPTNYFRIFKVENTIYIFKRDGGLYTLHKGEESLLFKLPPEFGIKVVLDIFKDAKGMFLVTRHQGIFIYNNAQLEKWRIPDNRDLENITVLSSIRLRDNSIVLGTVSKGVFHLDVNGELINRIDQTNGLSNNTILRLFEDAQGNIWTAMDNGINCLNYNSFIREFNDQDGTHGTVYCSSIYGDKLYLGTNQGLYVKPINTSEPYKLVSGAKGQVWDLTIADGKLFCGHTNGILIIEPDEVRQISSVPGTWGFRKVPENPDLLLAGHYAGISVLTRANGEWQFRNHLNGFTNSARFFEVLNEGEIWVNHEYKGVYRLQTDPDYENLLSVVLDTTIPKGRGSGLLKIDGKIVYSYEKGVYSRGKGEKAFILDSVLTRLNPPETYLSGKLVRDKKGRIWCFTQKSIRFLEESGITGENMIRDIPIELDRRKMTISFENISYLENDIYIVGKTNGYIRLELNKLQDYSHVVHLNSVLTTNYKTEVSNKMGLDSDQDIPYSQNSIRFQFSVPRFNKYEHIEYQCKLEGYDSDWNTWQSNNYRDYDKLPYGAYEFKLRSRIGKQLSSNSISFPFSVKRPLFFSKFAIVTYIGLFLSLLFVVHRSYKRYYRKKHEKLLLQSQRRLELEKAKSDQELVQLKNDRLNQEIESKNRELAISTMSIVRRNEVLRSIKKELLSGKNEMGNLAPVLKLIEKNLSSGKDWQNFKEAFDNADQDFLKNLKNMHPSLTHNDLKFCAYLRLNLTSKEIAPLLNISIKSVEIKRYRLRKKLKLESEKNLTDYIMSL